VRGDAHGELSHPPRPRLNRAFSERLSQPPALLDEERRSFIADAMPGICDALGWVLLAVNPRSNHVHLVVGGAAKPERMLTAIKAWTTRKLREAHLAQPEERLWSRHGSTVYLWTESDVDSACHYVLYSQDDKGDGGGAT
jgi:REP element-mobilizing transposase RayT